MLGILARSLRTGVLTERVPFETRASFGVPGHRLQPVHGLRRLRARVPDGRDPHVVACCRPEDR